MIWIVIFGTDARKRMVGLAGWIDARSGSAATTVPACAERLEIGADRPLDLDEDPEPKDGPSPHLFSAAPDAPTTYGREGP
jgi:hypothetical protein